MDRPISSGGGPISLIDSDDDDEIDSGRSTGAVPITIQGGGGRRRGARGDVVVDLTAQNVAEVIDMTRGGSTGVSSVAAASSSSSPSSSSAARSLSSFALAAYEGAAASLPAAQRTHTQNQLDSYRHDRSVEFVGLRRSRSNDGATASSFPQRNDPCGHCGMADHATWEHRCGTCGGVGHRARSCPDAFRGAAGHDIGAGTAAFSGSGGAFGTTVAASLAGLGSSIAAAVPRGAPWGVGEDIESPARRARKKSKKSKSTIEPPAPKPIEKGKALLSPGGFDSIDMYYPHLNAADRTSVLYLLLPEGYTKQWTHRWRIQYEKEHPKPTLWAMAAALSDEICKGGGLATTTAHGKNEKGKIKAAGGGCDGEGGKENQKPPAAADAAALQLEDGDEERKQLLTAAVGPLSVQVMDTLRIHFRAHVGKASHAAVLEQIQPAAEEESNEGALSCSICADIFEPPDTVPCSGEDELHFFCKPCFYSYATVTVQSGPVQSIECPIPGCKSLFATADAKANLSDWDLLMIERRENARDQRVALAAKAVLHCECGAVGIITEEDVGNGRVECPNTGCGRKYCCKCGNDDHGTEPCPPPAETVQWLDKHTKECPNCKNKIEKNGGCDHMTCDPPGGCGYEFWWTCGCPYREGHRPGCQRLGER